MTQNARMSVATRPVMRVYIHVYHENQRIMKSPSLLLGNDNLTGVRTIVRTAISQLSLLERIFLYVTNNRYLLCPAMLEDKTITGGTA